MGLTPCDGRHKGWRGPGVRWYLQRLCVLAMLGAPVGAWGERLTVTVAPEVLVQAVGPQFTIGDVAQVRGSDAATVARARQIVLGTAPPLGETRTFQGPALVARLKQYGLTGPDVELQVPAKIRLTRAAQRVAASALETAVRQAILKQMPWDPQTTTVQDIRGLEEVAVPPGDVRYEVTFPGHPRFLGHTSFSLALHVAGRVEKQLHGTAHIDVKKDVLTLARPLSQGETITAEALRPSRVSMAHLPPQAVTRPEDVIGKRTKRPLAANTPLQSHEFEAPPLVHKGDVVLIIAESALVKVTALGEALETGRRGATIRVKNTTSNREFRAQVIDTKTVRIAL